MVTAALDNCMAIQEDVLFFNKHAYYSSKKILLCLDLIFFAASSEFYLPLNLANLSMPV